MRWLSDLWFRFRALAGRDEMERTLDEEVRFHLEMEEAKYVRTGMSPQDARRKARLAFGGIDRQMERAREAWGVTVLHDLASDLRYALRQLRSRPLFAVVAGGTLALGIGGTAALAAVAWAIVVRPLPVADEAELVAFWSEYNWRGSEYDFVRNDVDGFEDVAAFSNAGVTLRTGPGSSMILTTVNSANLFEVLGARPLLGRTFQTGDDRPGAEATIVLSHGLWQGEFGGDPDIVGRRILVDGAPTTVLGVMPEDFFFPSPDMRAWMPLDLDPDSRAYQSNGWLVLVGRLLPGTAPARLQAHLDALALRLGERFTYPAAWDKTRDPHAVPLREYLLGDVRPAVLLLVGAVGILLLIAWANVAALLLTRAWDRSGEMGVRVALGAGRVRLARQLLTEAGVLAAVGGAAGLALALVGFDLLVAFLPLPNGMQATLAVDWVPVVLATAIAAASGAVVALAPVRALFAGHLNGGTLGQLRGADGAAPNRRIQQGLVVAEVALAVMLVSGAGLLVRSVDRLRSLDPGLDPNGVVVADIHMGAEETTPDERRTILEELVTRTAALPGVEAAGLINRLPVRDGGYQSTISIEDRPDLEGPARPNSAYRLVTPGTFDALDIEVLEGRGILPTDRRGSTQVVVVNEAFARAMWPGERALGRRIGATFSADWFEVVGVIRDVAVHDLISEVPMAAYYPLAQGPERGGTAMVLVAEATTHAEGTASALRGLVTRTDRRAAVGEITTMQDVLDRAMAENLRLRFFLGLFATLGLVLGTVGIYGVVAYGVERRRGEFGIRLALGARTTSVVGGVVRGSLAPLALGITLGVAGAVASATLLAGFLFEVAPRDPAALAAGATVLAVTGLVAALVPALRAATADPAAALRAE